jgi:alpha-L-fucosidase
MNIAKMGEEYTLMIEISAPKEEAGTAYTFRFLKSRDMTNWTMTPKECVFQKDRYAGSPALYTFEGDPYYYIGYLEAYPEMRYANSIARTKDLINYEYSFVNPVLMFDEYEDKKLANPFFTEAEQERIKNALDINNSDMELCEYNGRTVIYYSWGDQLGEEFLAEACYEGPMHEFLLAFFEPYE